MPRPQPAAVVAAGAVLVLLAGGGILVLQSNDRTTTYDEQAAVEAFRSSSPTRTPAPVSTATPVTASTPVAASARPAPPSPAAGPSARAAQPPPAAAPARTTVAPPPQRREVAEGVYRYATEGHEEVDALGGARHDYPATTTVTYSRTECGTEERWQPLKERIGVAVTCPGSRGAEVRRTFQQREFFGQSQSKTYLCDPGVLVLPKDPRAGQSWSATCTSGDSTARFAVRVVALEQLDVEGRPVPVVRVRLDGTLTGSTRGRSDREVWLSREDGLLVQAIGDTDTDADTAGGTVRYRETYRLRLLSLTPRR